MVCGKKDLSQPFHDPFTTHSQPRGNQNPRIPTRLFGVFHKFPTPYYGYYNKFNIETPVSRQFSIVKPSAVPGKTKERIQLEHRMR